MRPTRSATPRAPWSRSAPLGLGLLILLFLTTPPVRAASSSSRGGYWTLGTGRCLARRGPAATHYSLAYQPSPLAGDVRPSVGIHGTTVGDVFLYAGLRFDIDVVGSWGIAPLLTTGYYNQGGGMNLGGALEFRSGLEFFHRLGGRSRVGVSIHHISNAGLFDRNPGRESLLLNYTLAP